MSGQQALQEQIDEKAGITHQHDIDDVSGLTDALNNKANTTHQHQMSDAVGDALNEKAHKTHAHYISDVSGLELAITNLQDALNKKASTTHKRPGIADVEGLQDSLSTRATRATDHLDRQVKQTI